MPYIPFSERDKQTANNADIVSYLQTHGETVKKSGREHTWDSPSGKVSINGSQWYSQYEQTGGGPVGFVQKFFSKSYPEAVRDLLGQNGSPVLSQPTTETKQRPKSEPKELVLPPKNADMRRLYAYLLYERFLDRDVVRAFTHADLLYEDAEHHSAVFVGTDENGVPRHIQKRATSSLSDYKGNLTGSQADYSFHYVGTSDRLYVFEAPIDLLAYISQHKTDWQQHSYVALCSTADCAALWMLRTYPNLKTVYLCLDHDPAGIEGAYRVAESIHNAGTYEVFRIFPKNKDWDEDLKERNDRTSIPSSEHPNLEQMKEKISSLSEEDFNYQKILQRYQTARGFLQEDFLRDVERCLDRGEYQNAAQATLAFLTCRERQTEVSTDWNARKNALQTAYKPHRDKENGESQSASLRRSFGVLKAQLQEKDLFSFKEIQEQNRKWTAFAVDCLRLCCCIERENTPAPDEGQTME